MSSKTSEELGQGGNLHTVPSQTAQPIVDLTQREQLFFNPITLPKSVAVSLHMFIHTLLLAKAPSRPGGI